MTISRLSATVLLLVLGGCLEASRPPEDVPTGPVHPLALPKVTTCGDCSEPTLASDGDRLYATTEDRRVLLSMVQGVWQEAPGPDVPGRPDADEGDVFIQIDAEGRLWWSALVQDPVLLSREVHVARSDDHGKTWLVNHVLPWGPAGQSTAGAADRQWVAVDGERVLVVCTCPMLTVPQYRLSTDGGQNFGEPRQLVDAYGHAGPLGPPAVLDGKVIVPFLVGTSPAGRAVAALVSTDWLTWTRVDVAAIEDLAPFGGTVCCGFPNTAVGPAGFLVAFAGNDGRILLARSMDAVVWTLEDVGGAASYPHPWPVAVGTEVAVAWHGRDGIMQITMAGQETGLGASANVGNWDYVTAVLHAGHVITAWPDAAAGLAFGAVPVVPPTP